jgi:hypothetical protein
MGTLVSLVLCTLISDLAYAQGSGDVQPAQLGLPAQPGADSLPPQPGSAYFPSQTRKESGPRFNGLTLAVGLGYGAGFGVFCSPATDIVVVDHSGETGIGDAVSGQLPFSIGLGYRPIPLASFGVTLVFAPISLRGSGFNRPSSDRRLGGELRLHITPARPLSPWLSVGFGYEWFIYSIPASVDSYGRDTTATGYDFDFQVGGDVPMTGSTTIGPYVSLRVGTFRHIKTMCGDRGCWLPVEVDVPDADRATHEWLTVGIRGAFAIFTL